MRIRLYLVVLVLAAPHIAGAQADIEIGDLDPPVLNGLQGAMGCVAYHLEDTCSFVFGYVQNGLAKVILLQEFQRRLPSGRAEWLIVDVVVVPAEYSDRLESVDCRYDGETMDPIFAAISATGNPGDWVGPADWVVTVDWEQQKIVSGNPQLVECWQDLERPAVAPVE